MKDKKIRVVMLEVGKEARITEIDNTLESLQKTVNGYIEAVYPFNDEVALICNDEGKYNGMKPNRTLYGDDKDILDVIYGPFFICGCDRENFTSLTDKQIEKYTELFKVPEKVMCIAGKYTMVPCPTEN